MTAERGLETSAGERRAAARAAAARASHDGVARGLCLTPLDCPVCGDEAAEPQALVEDFQNPPSLDELLALRCSGCGCVYLSPGLSPADRNRALPEGDADDGANGGADGASRGVAGRLRRRRAALRLAGGKRPADPDRVADVRALGDAPVAEVTQTGRQYDCVILNQNLEYLSDPSTQLAAVRRTLRAGGRVVVELHNLASPSFAVFGGRHWAGYDFPRQRAVYPLRALERLAAGAGLAVDRVTSSPDPGCWVESTRRLLDDWGAPRSLANRFQASSVVAPAAFGLLERILAWWGRGARLVVSLRAGPALPESPE